MADDNLVTDLATENAALKAQVSALENALRQRDLKIEGMLRAKRRRVLDPKEASAFNRPYDGR